MIRRSDVIILSVLIFSVNALFGCTEKAIPKTEVKEEDPVTFEKRRRAERQIKRIWTALEAYITDCGFYPRDIDNRPGADIPDFLFVALNNKPTSILGGGPNSPYIEQLPIEVGLKKEKGELIVVDPKEYASLKSQGKYPPRKANEVKELDNLENSNLKGKLLYFDPWGHPYHYREWASKPETLKNKWNNQGKANARVHKPKSFDIWSNGPDGINNYGAKGSDDIKNWKD
ncbi:MAG: hypothetical protein P1V97_23470 [Planctomycetota bacterium]|nr:hypothetical protein [Planctomycetota bacterium]